MSNKKTILEWYDYEHSKDINDSTFAPRMKQLSALLDKMIDSAPSFAGDGNTGDTAIRTMENWKTKMKEGV